MKPLPHIRVPIVRYYTGHLFAPEQFLAHQHVHVSFAQTEYSQLLLTEISFQDKIKSQKTHHEDFESVENFTLDLDKRASIQMTILEHRELPDHLIVADVSEEILECLEIIFLFYKGAFYPGIHKMDMLMDMGVIALLPLRELLSRALPDALKVNILAEYQLMNFDRADHDFIDFNLIWFLGKLHLKTVDKFLQEESLRMDEMNEEEEDDEFSENPLPLSESDQKIKTELEDELRKFYLSETQFFTRVVGLRHHEFDVRELPEGSRLLISSEPDNKHDPFAVGVATTEGEKIGYLKRELSEIIYPELQQGIFYKATVAKVFPEDPDTNSRLHILVQKLTHHLN